MQYLGLVLGTSLFLALLLAPGLPLDVLQRKVAAVAALTAVFWLTVAIPVGAASLLPAALFPILGVLPAREVGPVYLRDLVLLFLGAFIVALGLERWGVHRRIALRVVQTVGSSRRRLVLGFMAASAFLSLWINNTATTLLMLPIVSAVLLRAEEEDRARGLPTSDPRFGWCLLLGVAYAASVGGMGTSVGTAPNQEFLGQFSTLYPGGPKLTFGEWFLAFGPLVALFVPIAWILLTRVIYRFEDVRGAASLEVREQRAALGRWRTPEKRMAAVFVATACLWVFRADLSLGSFTLPGWSRLFLGSEASDPAWYAVHKNDISDATVALALSILMFLIPSGELRSTGGTEARQGFLMDWKTASGLPWEVLLLLGGGFCLAHGFKISGLDRVVGESLAPLIADRPRWVVAGAVALFVSLLTEITSNTATTAVLLPVMAAAGTAAGLDPLAVMLPTTLAASAAFMMPVATPPNAVVFATRKIPVPAMARAGFLLNLLMVGLIVFVFEFWAADRLGVEATTPEWARPLPAQEAKPVR
ncbi:Sodium-dependent dicarboxylate transporter SdcS [Planctomycetes bacterium Poly30]|uniref:Sodium-dependent dicarboxylate transporter SdcS n=2 Tax=Saltatorellus ferox TaxID=2528018 RepID=A0A518EW77_9BACT|nr:Sodium-dependent dicarboxylate transporter SdcS [Planctomycetes bacterium Poly30]